MSSKLARRRGQAGASIVEFSLLAPWFIFLFVGAYDMGFYAHALISTENAARVAAIYSADLSSGHPATATACNLVLNELSIAANLNGVSTCNSGSSVTDSQPVAVSLSCTTLDSVNAVQVTVTYRTLRLIPIPGLLTDKLTLYRAAELPMNSNSSCTAS